MALAIGSGMARSERTKAAKSPSTKNKTTGEEKVCIAVSSIKCPEKMKLLHPINHSWGSVFPSDGIGQTAYARDCLRREANELK